jgi:hypothetical protein
MEIRQLANSRTFWMMLAGGGAGIVVTLGHLAISWSHASERFSPIFNWSIAFFYIWIGTVGMALIAREIDRVSRAIFQAAVRDPRVLWRLSGYGIATALGMGSYAWMTETSDTETFAFLLGFGFLLGFFLAGRYIPTTSSRSSKAITD